MTCRPINYEIGLDITPQGTVTWWGSIFHVTATDNNCCAYGDRVPGLWFMPASTKLYVVDGIPRNGNYHSVDWGCDDNLLTLTQGVTSRVVLQLSESLLVRRVTDPCGDAGRERQGRRELLRWRVQGDRCLVLL